MRNWLDRWSHSSFWEPLPQPKKTLITKPKRKPTKLQTEETETGRPKRTVRRISAANIDNSLSNSSENEKSKRTVRKVNHLPDSGQEQSINELEKVKRNLRKISVSTSVAPEKSETDTEKPSAGLNKEISENGTNHGSEKINGSTVESLKQPQPEPEPEPDSEPEPEPEPEEPLVQPHNDHPPMEPPSLETDEKVENEPRVNVESNGKENQKARRRKSLTAKQEHHESVLPNTPTVPSYMAATESAKAKLRAQAAAKAAEEVAENGSSRRQSLPSPRVQKPLQGSNGKGGSKPNKSQISPRDGKHKLLI